MNDYLVWYKESEITTEIVVGVARNYDKAEKMAEQLHFSLKHWEYKKVFQTGVTRLEINTLHTNAQSVDFPTRWVIMENNVKVVVEEE